MTIMQTVDIPADRRITLVVPREVPTGKANVIIQFPGLNAEEKNDDCEKTVYSTLSNEEAISMTGEVIKKYRAALEDLAK